MKSVNSSWKFNWNPYILHSISTSALNDIDKTHSIAKTNNMWFDSFNTNVHILYVYTFYIAILFLFFKLISNRWHSKSEEFKRKSTAIDIFESIPKKLSMAYSTHTHILKLSFKYLFTSFQFLVKTSMQRDFKYKPDRKRWHRTRTKCISP